MAKSDEGLWSLGTVRRFAALHGCVVRHMPEDQGDRLDILAELGGEATVRAIIEHEGGGRPQNAHARMQTMMRAGAVERLGKGTHSDPYRYRLTPIGDLLRLHR
jgi:hypothetical protein